VAWAMMIDLNRVYAGAYPPSRARSRFDSNISLDYDFKKTVPARVIPIVGGFVKSPCFFAR
jgi:hypothetical protein